MPKPEPAYLGPLFEGEGGIDLRVSHNQICRLVDISLSQKNWPLLNGVKESYGGRLVRNANCWQWRCGKTIDVINFLTAIHPYTCMQFRKIQLALRLCWLILLCDGRDPKVQAWRLVIEKKFWEAKKLRKEGFMEPLQ
jgi:hypothetical protein